jgi:predicted Zn-ribbon and HTH transcriptional regulator
METRREAIIARLETRPATVQELSKELEVKVKVVADDLEHVRRTVRGRFHVEPAECRACGLRLAKRDRLTAPSRCPRCRSERMTEPVLSIARSPVP